MNRIFGCFVAVGLLIGCVGCVSRTVVGIGPVRFGGRTELHKYEKPSVAKVGDEVRFTLGNLSVGVIGDVVDGSEPTVTVESLTGPTAVVEPPIVK